MQNKKVAAGFLIFLSILIHLFQAGYGISLDARWVSPFSREFTPWKNASVDDETDRERFLCEDSVIQGIVPAIIKYSGIIDNGDSSGFENYVTTVLSRILAVIVSAVIVPLLILNGSNFTLSGFIQVFLISVIPMTRLHVLENLGTGPLIGSIVVFLVVLILSRNEGQLGKSDGKPHIQMSGVVACGVLSVFSPVAGIILIFSSVGKWFGQGSSGIGRNITPEKRYRFMISAGLIYFATVIGSVLIINLVIPSSRYVSMDWLPDYRGSADSIVSTIGIPGLILFSLSEVFLFMKKREVFIKNLVPLFLIAMGESSGYGGLVFGTTAIVIVAKALSSLTGYAKKNKTTVIAQYALLTLVGMMMFTMTPAPPYYPVIEAFRWIKGAGNCRNIPVESSLFITWKGPCAPQLKGDDFPKTKAGVIPEGEEFVLAFPELLSDSLITDELGYMKIKTFGTNTNLEESRNPFGFALLKLEKRKVDEKFGKLVLYRTITGIERVYLDSDSIFERDEGKSWLFRFNGHPVCDSEHDHEASELVMFEDGEALGPPHAPHRWIRQTGGGFYSHWSPGTIYFSTSDGSNPNKNGREYKAIEWKQR